MKITVSWLGDLTLSMKVRNRLRMARGLYYGGRTAIVEIAYAFGWPEWYTRLVVLPAPGRYLPRGVYMNSGPMRAPWWERFGEPDPRITHKAG